MSKIRALLAVLISLATVFAKRYFTKAKIEIDTYEKIEKWTKEREQLEECQRNILNRLRIIGHYDSNLANIRRAELQELSKKIANLNSKISKANNRSRAK